MWVRGHSRSLKLIPFESLGAVFYSRSVVTMALVSFVRYCEIFVENCKIFILHLYLAPPKRVTRRNFARTFDTHKTKMIGLPRAACSEETRTIHCMLSSFHRISERDDRQTDGQTELLYQYRQRRRQRGEEAGGLPPVGNSAPNQDP